MLEFLTPGVGSAMGAIGQIAGGMMANAANAKQASAQMAFQERMLQQQNDFSREMFNSQLGAQQNLNAEARNWDAHMQGTAYQRAMNDMRSAGLNPMLAYMKGGAGTGNIGAGSAPSGSVSSAPSGAQARMENVTAGLASTAMDAARVGPQVKLLQSQAEQGEAQTALIGEQQRLAKAQVDNTQANTGLTVLQQATEAVRPGFLRAQTGLAGAQTGAAVAGAHASYGAAAQSYGQAEVSSAEAQRRREQLRREQGWGTSIPGQLGATGENVYNRVLRGWRDLLDRYSIPRARE